MLAAPNSQNSYSFHKEVDVGTKQALLQSGLIA